MELQDIVDKIGQLQQTEENLYSILTQNSENVALGNPNTLSDEEINILLHKLITYLLHV